MQPATAGPPPKPWSVQYAEDPPTPDPERRIGTPLSKRRVENISLRISRFGVERKLESLARSNFIAIPLEDRDGVLDRVAYLLDHVEQWNPDRACDLRVRIADAWCERVFAGGEYYQHEADHLLRMLDAGEHALSCTFRFLDRLNEVVATIEGSRELTQIDHQSGDCDHVHATDRSPTPPAQRAPARPASSDSPGPNGPSDSDPDLAPFAPLRVAS